MKLTGVVSFVRLSVTLRPTYASLSFSWPTLFGSNRYCRSSIPAKHRVSLGNSRPSANLPVASTRPYTLLHNFVITGIRRTRLQGFTTRGEKNPRADPQDKSFSYPPTRFTNLDSRAEEPRLVGATRLCAAVPSSLPSSDAHVPASTRSTGPSVAIHFVSCSRGEQRLTTRSRGGERDQRPLISAYNAPRRARSPCERVHTMVLWKQSRLGPAKLSADFQGAVGVQPSVRGDDGGGRPGVVAAHGIDLSDGSLDIDGGEGPERRLGGCLLLQPSWPTRV